MSDITARFREILGADAVEMGPGVRAFRADNIAPRWVLFPTTIEELSRCAAAAHAAELATIPTGNGTQLGVGGIPYRYDVALSTRRLRKIIAHEAADMTVTVEAGLTVAELNAALAPQGQWLPLDPPHPEWTTLGALIATDATGPLRLSRGKVRDLLLGVTVVLADGTVVHGGGRVVKNVAGYDLMKLFTGSFGTLGIVVGATFKIYPRPERLAVWTLPARDLGEAAAIALDVVHASLAPLYVEAVTGTAIHTVAVELPAALVVVGAGGSSEEIDVHGQRLAGLQRGRTWQAWDGVEGQRLYEAIRDFPAVGLPGAAGCGLYGCRLSTVPTRLGGLLARIEHEAGGRALAVTVSAHAGNGAAVLRFQAAPADDVSFASFAEWLRDLIAADGAWLVFDILPPALKERIDPWGPGIPGLEHMRGIKQALDPQRRLSPGRFVGGI